MKVFIVRNIANRLIQQANTVASLNRRPWTQAMAAEIDHIDSDWEALDFAIGGYTTTLLESIKMQKFEPLIRWILAFIALVWATAKIYLLFTVFNNSAGATVTATPNWLNVILIAAAFSYAGSAYSLVKKKFLLFGTFLIAALATNSAFFAYTQFHFFLSDFQPANNLTWVLAFISEEYFMWTAILFGAAIMIALKYFDRVRIVFRQA